MDRESRLSEWELEQHGLNGDASLRIAHVFDEAFEEQLARPDNVDRLILDAFVWTGEGSPTLAKRREGLAEYRASNMRKLLRQLDVLPCQKHDIALEPVDALGDADGW